MNPHDALTELQQAIGPVTREVIACGVVVSTWRDPMEVLHDRLGDHEMAYVNIATTVAVADCCEADEAGGTIDWDCVLGVLTDPGRTVLPGRSAKEVAGDRWGSLLANIRESVGGARRQPAIAHAGFAFMVVSNWWGMPGYADQISGLLATGRVTAWTGTEEQLTEALVHDPLAVPLEVWDQIVGGNGLGWHDR